MKSQLSCGWLDYEPEKSEDESPLETPWSEENECLPLKQRMKMLRAKAALNKRNEVLIPAILQADDVVNKENVISNSNNFYPNQDGGKGRSVSDSCKQRKHGQHPSGSDDIENPEYFNEDLDHVLLKERRRILLSRKLVRPIRPAMKFNSPDTSKKPIAIAYQNSGLGGNNCGKRSANAIAENVILKKRNANIYRSPTCTNQHEDTTTAKPQNSNNVCKEANTCYSGRNDINEKRLLSNSCKDLNILHLKPFANVKVETLEDDLKTPNRSMSNQIAVKVEALNNSESLEDIIDHMMLGDRMRLLASRKFPETTTVLENFETGVDHKSKLSKSPQPIAIKKPRKRRRTATDSIETALEEDAPGLLKVLMEKGVLVDEIKLYGANDEPLDESLVDESFSDLEDVITKIFSHQQSLFKFAPIRCGRGEKTTYCLACLISLVEQARYLRVRKWPVEWGWCRDLQSFIFVFNKHNRIVLERPEYGYATYFFELVDALPVNWQIKRLVTAMKLTSCTRITLIENRSLKVGDDLTEGEARVLMEYGWIPDSGLGTMLNYCDRVVHDRKNDTESDSSEWRSKIGKLLTNGYNGGIIVPNDIPKRVMEYGIPEIKLEY